MLRRVPCYGCAFCASLRSCTECTSVAGHSYQRNTTQHAATIPNWYNEINVTLYCVTLARTIWLPDNGPRTETCRSVFNVLMCKNFIKILYMCSSWYNNWVTRQHARCNNENSCFFVLVFLVVGHIEKSVVITVASKGFTRYESDTIDTVPWTIEVTFQV